MKFITQKKTLIPISIIFIIYLNLTLSYSAAEFDPDLKWKSIKTDHFYIHYHVELKKIAIRLSKIAERVHKRLVKVTGWEPFLRTDVIIVDNTDLANGFATPLTYNKIQIYISRPVLDSILNNFDDWLELVFTHEYTHILNLDTAYGIPQKARYILGRNIITFPNLFLPIWAIEGYAVYQESENSFGRNNSTYTDMVFRTEIISSRFKSITKASHFPREWPRGGVPYLYGGKFVEYLEKNYEKKSFAEYFRENGDNIIPYSDNIYPMPYFFNKDAKDIYKKSFERLWFEWEFYIKNKYYAQIKNIRREKISEFLKISDLKKNSTYPRFSRDGKLLYYIMSSPRDGRALIVYDMDKGKTRKLSRVNYPNSIATAKNNKIILSDMEYYNNFSLYYEAFTFDRGYKKITKRLRGRYIDLFKNDDRCIYVKNDYDKYSLIISDMSFRTEEKLISKSDVQISYPRISPDNRKIVFTIKDRRGHSDLVLLNIENSTFYRLTDDRYNDIQPSWHPDNKRIIFSSDRNGVYNLYEFSIPTKQMKRLTNITGGAFSPDIPPDGNFIAISSYESRGHVISLLNYPESYFSNKNMNIKKLDKKFFHSDIHKSKNADILKKITPTDYNPINSVMPSSFLPVIYIDSDMLYSYIGLGTFAWDALKFHSYTIFSYTYFEQKRAVVDTFYTFSKFYPEISIGYYDNALIYGRDKFPWKIVLPYQLYSRTLSRAGYLGIHFPFNYFNSWHGLQFLYIVEREFNDTAYSASLFFNPTIFLNYIFRQKNTFTRIRVKYSYSNTRSFLYSISPEDGRKIFFKTDIYLKKLGSDYSFYKLMAGYSEYLPGIFQNNVFMLRITGGAAVKIPDYNSESSGEYELDLRGYRSGEKYGNRTATAIAEYRFPILQYDLGYSTLPVMFRDLWLEFFFEYGNVWMGSMDLRDFSSSAGVEAHVLFSLGFGGLDLTGYIGYAKGLNKYGESRLYFGIKTFIEGIFNNSNKRLDIF